MNIFGIGLPEMILIFIVALLIFGPKKLPEIGRSLAKTLRSFQAASKEFEAELKREAAELEKVTQQEPLEATLEKSPPQALSPADTKVKDGQGAGDQDAPPAEATIANPEVSATPSSPSS